MNNYFYNYCKHYEGLPSHIWIIIGIQLINSTSISIIYFLSLYFVNALYFDVTTAGLLISAFGFGTVFGGLIGGNLADYISAKKIVIVSLILQSISFLFLSTLNAIAPLTLILFLLGISTYSFITANFIWALSYTHNEEQRLKTINILDAVANIGLGISAIICSLLPIQHLKFISFVAAIILLLVVGYLIFTKRFSLTNAVSYSELSLTRDNKLTSHGILSITLVLASLFLVGFIITQFCSTYSIYLHTLFPSSNFEMFGLVFALNTFLIVILQTPIANYGRRFNRVMLMSTGAFLLSLGMTLLVLSTSFYWIILTSLVYTLGEILFFSVAQLICYENAPANKKGFILGIYRIVYAMSRMVGPFVGAYVYQQFGSNALWQLCGILGGSCFMITIYFEYSRNLVQMEHR